MEREKEDRGKIKRGYVHGMMGGVKKAKGPGSKRESTKVDAYHTKNSRGFTTVVHIDAIRVVRARGQVVMSPVRWLNQWWRVENEAGGMKL